MLAAALAIAAPAAAQTAKPGAASKPADPDAERTVIEADVIDGVSDLEVSARGNAEIRRDDMTIFGETLRYNRETGRAEGDGGVRLQRGADRFFGPHLQYNILDDTGAFESPSYLLERDRTARGTAERIEFLGRERYRLTNANYTTCRPGQEDWRVEASEIELDFEEEEGTASHPRLRFFDTTILASPWATFPLGDRRRSGLLTPYYAQTSSRGFEFGIPYYWNIAPEYDATFTPVFMAKRGYQLKNQFRYLQRPFTGELKFEYLPDDREFNDSREGVSWQHTHNFPRNTVGTIDYNRVSDDRYFTDLGTSVKQLSVGNLPQDAYLTHGGSLGRAPYSAQLRFQRFQTLQDPLAPTVPPYHRIPQVNLSVGYNDLAGALDTALPAEYVRFTHPTLVEGARSSLSPTLAVPFLAPGYFVTPKAGLRYVSYGLTRTAPGQPQAPEMSLPWGSLDSGLIFERDTTSFGQGSTQTLEPRLFYVYVPFRDQDDDPDLRHRARRLQLRAALHREPLRRRRPLRRREPADRRAHLPHSARRRPGGAARHARPALLLRRRARRTDADQRHCARRATPRSSPRSAPRSAAPGPSTPPRNTTGTSSARSASAPRRATAPSRPRC